MHAYRIRMSLHQIAHIRALLLMDAHLPEVVRSDVLDYLPLTMCVSRVLHVPSPVLYVIHQSIVRREVQDPEDVARLRRLSRADYYDLELLAPMIKATLTDETLDPDMEHSYIA